MAEVTILRDAEILSFRPERSGKKDRLVVYQAGPGLFGTVTLPAETATEAAILAAIREDMRARASLAGRVFSVP